MGEIVQPPAAETPAIQGNDTDAPGPGEGLPQDAALNAQILADVSAAMGSAAQGADGAAPAPPATPQAIPSAAPPPTPTEGQPAAAAPPADEPRIAAQLRARREAQKTREAARGEAERLRDEVLTGARTEAERIIKEAQAKADAEYRAKLGKLETDPLGAIRDLKWDPARLVDEVVKEGTPEWRLAKQQAQEIAALRAENEEFKKWRGEQTEQAKTVQDWQRQQYRQRATQEFVSLASAEKAPHLRASAEEAFKRLEESRALLGDAIPGPRSVEEILIAMGDAAEKEYVSATGEVAPLSDLVQYLEYQARQRGAVNAPVAAPPAPGAKSAGQPRAQGPRTLSAGVTSERRSAPKPTTHMTREELDAALLESVTEAMRKPAA